jgi:hypothetical protein
VCRMDYEPNNSDILNAAGLTSSNGVACTDFIFPHLPYDSRTTEDLEHQQSSVKLVTSSGPCYFFFPSMNGEDS